MIGQVGQRLSEGRNLVGMMHFTGSPMILECMASAGMDFVNIDLEHSPIDLELAAHLIRAADAGGITPFVRVPDIDAGLIKKMLNLGARGIIIPHATVQSCHDAVRALRYAPEGESRFVPGDTRRTLQPTGLGRLHQKRQSRADRDPAIGRERNDRPIGYDPGDQWD